MKRIAVLMGGDSSEREVSLDSGRNIAEALAGLGKYDVVSLDVRGETLDGLPDGIDAAYIALHGGWGENGGVQATLNARKIPYTGPGVLASQIAMDKVKTKMVLEMKGVPTAKWSLASAGDETSPLPLPVVVKPPCDGSSVGISKVSRQEQWKPALAAALACNGKVEEWKGGKVEEKDEESRSSRPAETQPSQPLETSGSPYRTKHQAPGTILVEEFVPGREFTVGVIDGEAMPVVEIVAKGGWYGYDEKYRSNETRYPFLENDPLADKLQKLAVDAYHAVGCRGVTRVDFRVSPLGRCYVLELNTSPGFTSHSLVPKAGMRTGLTFAQVCDRILQSADYDR